MWRNDNGGNDLTRAFRLLILVGSTVILVCACLGLSGCKATKTIYKEEIRWHDSTRIEVVQRYDTTHIQVVDTSSTHVENEKEKQTHITFGEGGGTYNATTGVATNVTDIFINSKEKELLEQKVALIFDLERVTAERDSLQECVSERSQYVEKQKESTPVEPSFYKRFFWWMFGLLLVVLLGITGYFVVTKTPWGQAIRTFLRL